MSQGTQYKEGALQMCHERSSTFPGDRRSRQSKDFWEAMSLSMIKVLSNDAKMPISAKDWRKVTTKS